MKVFVLLHEVEDDLASLDAVSFDEKEILKEAQTGCNVYGPDPEMQHHSIREFELERLGKLSFVKDEFSQWKHVLELNSSSPAN
jgi:hypothetical protein